MRELIEQLVGLAAIGERVRGAASAFRSSPR
jgi:hypothetical protein